MTAPLPPEGFYPDSERPAAGVAPARAFVPQPKDDPFYTYSGSKPLGTDRAGNGAGDSQYRLPRAGRSDAR